MLFQFAPAIQAGIETGKYLQVFSNGLPLSMARDAVTGQFVANAIGATVNNSPLSPLVGASKLMMSGVQMYQTNQGFASVLNGLQTLQTSMGVLQATTALIGVGTFAGVALTAVNLHQTLKLRKEVEQMRLEVKNGFIDLKQALKDQGAEIRQLIEEVAQDIKFEQHRTILIRAYGLFFQAMNRFRSAMQLQDIGRRNAEIDSVRGMFFEALADYTNPHLLSETCAAGKLRRLECAWAIEQGIVATYQAQKEMSAVSDRLYHLQNTISENVCTVIDSCDSWEELDFLFPEISRIRYHDLAVVETWHNQVDWMRSLSPSGLKLLNSADFKTSESQDTPDTKQATTVLAPPEQLTYENLSEKSHFSSLRDQLIFMFKPALRQDYEAYVNQQANIAGYKMLVPKNLQQASDLTIANLYYYFQIRDESETEEVQAVEAITAM
ncbi:hypothetical protein [Nodularia sphaerocarpa]|uniref:hypothetical protein n=1 Tax=Nodularia sphaerocarpa TaxID=137816 RepID=UPI001EFBEFAD|nr:hypothetical protein [Nodularia sphaerocarpa]MDB9372303.1 hypothetical protein [Nodularia sphaerocarpa CS-585]MDB9376324.1 hypothetical protein [Nodularia sphaerocarpa CS-585A2]ULP74529.1 hypothetical protein BDGGKGIB_04198 [Nodularia sphaerocarpa UHCC 0038]